MHLSEVVINNYCSCEAVSIPLSDFNPIVGYNNSGKSNILRAISWLLRKSVIQAHMFHDPAISLTVEGVIVDVNLQLLPPNQQAAVTPYVNAGNLKVRRRQDTPNCAASQVKLDVFNHQNGTWIDNPVGLDTAIAVLFPEPIHVEAMDDVSEDVGKFASKNTLGLLLKQVIANINANNALAIHAIQNSLTAVSQHLTGPLRMAELGAFENDATNAISSFFPGLSLQLNISTPLIDDLFKSSTITLSDQQGIPRSIGSFGHGAQRSAHMGLIKLLADLTNAAVPQGGTVVLLIDEPELYLHPQAIELLRESLLQLSTQNFQIIFSTHSPLLIGRANALQTVMIYKDIANKTIARQKLSDAAAAFNAHQHHAEAVFSIQTATHLLFSEKVLLVEGKTELMILPQIYQIVKGHSYAHDKGCLVSGSSSSSLLPMVAILSAVGFTPKVLADLDFAFKIAPAAGLLDPQSQEFIDCMNWFAVNAAVNGFYLDAQGFPTRKDPISGAMSTHNAAEAFELLAAALPGQIAIIANALLIHNIWIWSGGAIEVHLGIGKNDSDRIGFLATATLAGNLNHAATPQKLIDLANWL